MLIIYLDPSYRGLCRATACNKVRFQFATLSFVTAAVREREKQFEAALIKKVSAKSAGIVSQLVQKPTGLCRRVLGTVWLSLNPGLCFIQAASPRKSEAFHVSRLTLPEQTGSATKSSSHPRPK